MLPEEQLALLEDIVEAAQQIQNYLSGVTREQFLADTKLQDAVAMRFIVLGEAARDLTEETRQQFSEIPFHLMAGQRNIIAHAYGRINFERIYETAQRDIAPLIQKIKPFLE